MTVPNVNKPFTPLEEARAFFERNPDEVLTREDIQIKFGCSRDVAGSIAKVLIREGVRRDQLPRSPRKPRLNRRGDQPFPHNLEPAHARAVEAVMAHGTIGAAVAALGLTYSTVETYLRHARAKAGVNSTAALVVMYREARGQ